MSHVVVVQLLAAVAVCDVQEPTGVGPVVTGVGQVVVNQALAALPTLAVQLATGTFVVLLVPQEVVVQLFPAEATAAEHDATPTGPVVAVEQVVSVKLFADTGETAVQLATGVGPVVFDVGQVVVVQLLPADATAEVHDATGTFVVTTGEGQVTAVQPLIALAAAAVQVATATLAVSLAAQVTSIQSGVVPDVVTVDRPAPSAHVAGLTAVGPDVTLLQVVVVHEFPAFAATGVQVCTAVGPVVIGEGHVTVTQSLAGAPVCGVQEPVARLTKLVADG